MGVCVFIIMRPSDMFLRRFFFFRSGYVLGLIIEAALQRQLATTHPDLIHVTAHFIKSASVAPFEVHIRILKSGRAFSNLTADFIQEVRQWSVRTL